MKVLITSNSFGKFDGVPRQKMEALGWELIGNRYNHIMNEDEMVKEVDGVDAIILGSDTVSEKVLKAAKDLKIISRYGVGIDNINLEVAKEMGIEVTITSNCNTQAVGDYTIGLMLATLRHICNVDHHLKKNEWIKETGLDLTNKTVGVFGLGAIGKEVIKRLKGFNCTILGYDQYIDETYCKSENITIKQPNEIFKEADIITLHIPGNKDGTHVISQKELDMMSPSTVIINTARASLIDEDALINALKDKKIYGYGCDVFVDEPHINTEFQALNNVVLSPHNAAVSVEAINKMSHKAVNNLIEYFSKNRKE